MVKFMLSAIFFTLVAVVCQGKPTKEVAEVQKMKASVVRQLRKSTGVDVTKLKMVHRSGQNLQAATNGWAYINVYAFDDCSAAQGFYTVGIATNVCLMSRPEYNMSARSYYYTCNDDIWTRQEFENTNCDVTGLSATTNLNVTAPDVCGIFPPPIIGDENDDSTNSTITDDDGIDFSIYNAIYNCSASNSVNLGSNYVLSQYYNSDTCSQMGSFDGWLDGGCFPFNLQDIFDDDFNDDYLANVTYASYLTDYSNEYYFLGPNCTGNVIGVSSMDKLVKKCSPADDAYYYYDDDADADDDDDNTAADDDDVDDDYVGIEWTGYTSALTCTVPDNTNCNPSSSDDDGLSDGAVAGAVVGSVAGVALIGGGVFLVAKGGLFGSGGGMAAAQAGTAADAAANSAL